MLSNVFVLLGCVVLVAAIAVLTADLGWTLLALAVVLLALGYLAWRFPPQRRPAVRSGR